MLERLQKNNKKNVHFKIMKCMLYGRIVNGCSAFGQAR